MRERRCAQRLCPFRHPSRTQRTENPLFLLLLFSFTFVLLLFKFLFHELLPFTDEDQKLALLPALLNDEPLKLPAGTAEKAAANRVTQDTQRSPVASLSTTHLPCHLPCLCVVGCPMNAIWHASGTVAPRTPASFFFIILAATGGF